MALRAKDDKIKDLKEQVGQLFLSCYTSLFPTQACTSIMPMIIKLLLFYLPQLRDLMAYLEAEKTVEQLSISNEIKDGTVLPMSVDSSTSNGTNVGKGKKSSNSRRG